MAAPLVLLMGFLAGTPPATEAVIPDATPVHLAVDLRVAHAAELDDFRRAQKDPGSAEYGRFLTPEEFGRRFGPSAQLYERACAWLRDGGLTVTEFPNRIFIEGLGTAGQVTKLLGIHLQSVEGQPASVHVPDGSPRLPPWLTRVVLHVSGLDTRVRYHHHVATR